MKGFTRSDLHLSLCGLNCLLCPMHLGDYCGGCGAGNQSCAIARCSLGHGAPEYCFQCPEYPCARYDGAGEHDSFITHRNQLRDLGKIRRTGIAAYAAEQERKRALLERLLSGYNDGRRKTLYCVAVNLLEAEDVERALAECDALDEGAAVKERASHMASKLREIADQRGIELRLRKGRA